MCVAFARTSGLTSPASLDPIAHHVMALVTDGVSRLDIAPHVIVLVAVDMMDMKIALRDDPSITEPAGPAWVDTKVPEERASSVFVLYAVH